MFMNLKSILLVLVWSGAAACGVAADFNVLDYGATGTGTTSDTAAIQRAINAAAAAGNGARVLVPFKYRFLTGTLQLRSRIDFHISGELLISTNPADYTGDAVLAARDATNLTISGWGRISGRSLEFMAAYDLAGESWLAKAWRPEIFRLTACTNVVVRDLTFGDAPYWGLHLLGCENVLVDGLKIDNRLDVPNCDGIDPDHCRHVEIRGCSIISGDDAIVIKTTRQARDYGPSANIRVHDCVLETQSAGLKIGTETTEDIHDIQFEHCKIISASRGLSIQLRDEGNISQVVFRDIQFTSRYQAKPWWGMGEAISFTAMPRNPDTKLGQLHDILIQNVSGHAENSLRLNGTSQSRLGNIRLENVSLKLDRWTKYPGGFFDNRPTWVLTPLEVHPTDAYNLRCADRITLQNCGVTWGNIASEDFRNALQADDVTTLQLSGFQGDSIGHPIVLH
jgi:hypothetical protein